tara:strand:+ start:723 stop:881 length:159 start_codon:yes stop_codon:yes gene_type:complete
MGKIKALVTEYGWKKAEYIINQIKHTKKVKNTCENSNKSLNSTTKKGERKCR